MSCKKIQNQIPGFLKSALAPSDEQEVLNHLNVCIGCRQAYQKIRQDMQAVNDKNDPSGNPSS